LPLQAEEVPKFFLFESNITSMKNQPYSFASDNSSGAHPEILKAIVSCNEGYFTSYGDDPYSQSAIKEFQHLFNSNVDVFFVINGTGANVISLSACCRSYESIICAESAHINTDECGAIENFIGCKILPLKAEDGKIFPSQIEPILSMRGNVHHNQPGVISITQPTELGTLYTTEEIKGLADFAHQHGLLLHIDGARIANATAALSIPIDAFTINAGVDIMTFGGTKNGMLFGEAILVFNKKLVSPLTFIRKQGMQLVSKMRYIGAQYLAYLHNDLWLQNATNANNMASYFESLINPIKQVEITQKVQSNSLFVKIPAKIFEPLLQFSNFYEWKENFFNFADS
jgi:threonine aldolase